MNKLARKGSGEFGAQPFAGCVDAAGLMPWKRHKIAIAKLFHALIIPENLKRQIAYLLQRASLILLKVQDEYCPWGACAAIVLSVLNERQITIARNPCHIQLYILIHYSRSFASIAVVIIRKTSPQVLQRGNSGSEANCPLNRLSQHSPMGDG